MFKSDVVDYTKPLKDENKPDNAVLKHRKESIKENKKNVEINSANSTEVYNTPSMMAHVNFNTLDHPSRNWNTKLNNYTGAVYPSQSFNWNSINSMGIPQNDNYEGYHNSKL